MNRPKGFLLITSNLVLIGMATLVAVEMNRSISELSVASRTADLQRAFYLAEGGLDIKLRQFLDSDTLNDLTTIAPTTIGQDAYKVGSYYVTAVPVAGSSDTWQVTSTGLANNTSKVLRLTLRKTTTFPIPGAVTAVGEGGAGMRAEFQGGTLKVDGCDAANPGTCLPGLAVTTANEYADFANYIDDSSSYFGDRLVGAPGDYQNGQPPGHYSVKQVPQGPSGWNYAMLDNLATYAKTQAQANGCAFGDTVQDKTLGTLAAPKICYAEGDGTVAFKGINSGAGILVVKGTMGVASGDVFDYDGIVIVIGQEMDMDGWTTIRGATIFGRPVGNPQFSPSCPGLIQYNSQRVAMAQDLLSGWSGGSGSGGSAITVEAWY